MTLKKGLLLIPLTVMTLAYQNCGKPFHAAKFDGTAALPSSSGSGPDVLMLQQQSLTLLSANCKSCHVDQALGGVTNILNVSHLLNSGLIVAGQMTSPLLQAIEQNRMPPGSPMSATDKTTLRSWVLALGGMGPTGQPIDLTFTMAVNTEPLIFQNRFAKLSMIPGPASPSLTGLQTNRIALGDYNYANGVLPKYSWEATDMKLWLDATTPVCASADSKTRFPWPSGMPNLVQSVLGRGVNTAEAAVLNEIDAIPGLPASEKFEIFCMTVVGSLEFISK